jgi:hypothetical protein
MGTANGQTRDSARISLSHRTLDGLATTFNDYAGFAYTAADLQQLQEQASLLESSGHQAFLKIAHIVLSPYGQINEELEGQALSKLLGDKELLFYVYFASADLPRPAFSVAVVNSDMTEDEISGIEEYLAAAMQSHSEGGASMPDVLAHGIKLYQMMAASDLSFEYRAAGLNLAAPELVYKLEKDMQFVAVSGVPIKLPAGSRAYFYSRSEDSTRIGMLKSFKLPGSDVEERPFYWKSGAHEGKFAGYGHWQEALDTAAWVKFYSYENFLRPLPHCNAPPYDLGEIVTVTLGFPMPCGLNQLAKLDLHSRLYEVSWADLSLPGSDGVQGNTGNGPPPPYRAANEARTIYEVKEQVRPGLAIFEMDCSQEVQSADYLPPLAPFPCGLENVLPASVLLEKGDSTCAVAYLPDGTIAMAFIYKQRLHLAYEYYAGEIVVVRYLAEHDIWEYVNIDGDSFLAHAGIVLGWAGEMAATAAPFVLLAANFAVGAGASALGFSARALFLIDLGMSAVDAGLVYALTDDAQQAVQAFAVGVLTVGTGILVHKAIKAYKADKLNAVLRFQKVKSNGELGEAIKVDLASYRNGLRSKGWEDPDINKLFDDMAESEGLARYLLSDLERVKAWDALFDLPLLRTNTTKLQAVSDFTVAKNIDLSLIKTELSVLSNYKDDLIKSIEISNGTLPHPLITNKGVVQTDGNLLGRLVNGQFVPVGNANAAGNMDYVIMQSGEILLGSKHTFLSGGADVLAAGTVKFNNGSIELMRRS